MRKYGSKKSSRPFERLHRDCSACAECIEAPIKSRRSNEKKNVRKEIQSEMERTVF